MNVNFLKKAAVLVALMVIPMKGQCESFELPPVDVYQVSMADYINEGGSTTVIMKARSAAYLDALKVERKRVAGEVRLKIKKCEHLVSSFEAMNALFQEFARQTAIFSDMQSFYDFETGKLWTGTAVGLAQASTEAALNWQFIQSCLAFLQPGEFSRFSFPPVIPGCDAPVGGYQPRAPRNTIND